MLWSDWGCHIFLNVFRRTCSDLTCQAEIRSQDAGGWGKPPEVGCSLKWPWCHSFKMESSQNYPYLPFSSFHSAMAQSQVCRNPGCLRNLRTSPEVRGKLGVKDVRGSPVPVLMHPCQWPCKEWPGCGHCRCCLLQLEELDCVQVAEKCWVSKRLVLILGYHHQSPWFIITILEAGIQQFTLPPWEWEGRGNSCFPFPCSCPKGYRLSTILGAFRNNTQPTLLLLIKHSFLPKTAKLTSYIISQWICQSHSNWTSHWTSYQTVALFYSPTFACTLFRYHGTNMLIKST